MSNNIFEVYFVLTGNYDKGAKRALSVLNLIKKDKVGDNSYLILISGSGGLNTDFRREDTLAYMYKNILVDKGGSSKNILLECDSKDTIGNMLFSYATLKKICDKHENVRITLITEKFHMKRSRFIFNSTILSFLKNDGFLKNVKIRFFSVNNRQVSLDVAMKRLLVEFVGLRVLELDFKKYKLKTFQDYLSFLRSLFVYEKSELSIFDGVEGKFVNSKSAKFYLKGSKFQN